MEALILNAYFTETLIKYRLVWYLRQGGKATDIQGAKATDIQGGKATDRDPTNLY